MASLDRLARSSRDLLNTLHAVSEGSTSFKSRVTNGRSDMVGCHSPPREARIRLRPSENVSHCHGVPLTTPRRLDPARIERVGNLP
jgi:hypothetical protein